VPLVETAGKGVAHITYDAATRVVSWTIDYSGLSGPVTMAHFHGPAGKGENAGVQVWLTKQGSPAENPITGQATLTPEQARTSPRVSGTSTCIRRIIPRERSVGRLCRPSAEHH
jgi:hypothetical protein